jgi:hypothetical protein
MKVRDNMEDSKGFCAKPLAMSKSVGGQGDGGALAGQPVMGVSNPTGQEPQNIGGGKMPLVQMPVQPIVGK